MRAEKDLDKRDKNVCEFDLLSSFHGSIALLLCVTALNNKYRETRIKIRCRTFPGCYNNTYYFYSLFIIILNYW